MFEQLNEWWIVLVGRDGEHANYGQMGLRAVIVYGFALFAVRVGKKRFLGQNSAFDVVLLFILGSVLSRGINGSPPMSTTLMAGLVLVLLHRLCSWAAFHSPRIGDIIKGHTHVLVVDGQIQQQQARHAHITEDDLMEGLRRVGVSDLSRVKKACLERNGNISVIERDDPA